MDILNSIGLQDPHRQLQKELDSWDIWNMEDADRKKDLKKMCSQWLDRWCICWSFVGGVSFVCVFQDRLHNISHKCNHFCIWYVTFNINVLSVKAM